MLPQPTLPLHSIHRPLKLNELSESLERTPDLIVRSVDEILEALEQSRSESISPLEWIYCLHEKDDWDREHQEKVRRSSINIWKAAIENPKMAYLLHSLLLYRLALYYSGNKKSLPKSLVENFSEFFQILGTKIPLKFNILQALSSENPDRELAEISWKNLVLPKQLLTQENLPSWIASAQKGLENITGLFISSNNPSKERVEFLIKCLEQMSVEQQIQSVNNLLSKVPVEYGSQLPQLVSWLKVRYRTGEFWSRLTDNSKKALQAWIGSVNYRDFENLVDLVISKLPPQDKAVRQLRNRKGFWSNYGTRFERLRILLPESSISAIGSQLKGTFERLKFDNSDPTEICIFDFGNCFVVEFFRGRGSETRLFEKNNENEVQLFGTQSLSTKSIRAFGGKTHDHVFCWQFYCEKWLREKGNFPDEGTRYFKGLHQDFGEYSQSNGLPAPSKFDQEKRESQLINWKAIIGRLESEARIYPPI